MSISPAQMAPQTDMVERPTLAGRSTTAPDPTAAKTVELPGESPAAAPACPSPPKLTTNMRVDDQRRIYYEVVNDRTGTVVCQIPPEVIRKLGEDFKASQDGETRVHNVDVKL